MPHCPPSYRTPPYFTEQAPWLLNENRGLNAGASNEIFLTSKKREHMQFAMGLVSQKFALKSVNHINWLPLPKKRYSALCIIFIHSVMWNNRGPPGWPARVACMVKVNWRAYFLLKKCQAAKAKSIVWFIKRTSFSSLSVRKVISKRTGRSHSIREKRKLQLHNVAKPARLMPGPVMWLAGEHFLKPARPVSTLIFRPLPPCCQGSVAFLIPP